MVLFGVVHMEYLDGYGWVSIAFGIIPSSLYISEDNVQYFRLSTHTSPD